MRQPTKLTACSVEKLKPESTRYEVADTEIPGFRVRVAPSGVKTYALLYRNQEGKRQRFTIGKHGGLATIQARKIAGQTLAKVKLGKDPQHEKRTTQRTSKIPTVVEFVNGPYAEYINSKLKRPDMTLHRLNAVFSQRIKDTPLDKLTAWNVEKWRQERIKSGIKPVTINRDIAALRSVYSTAMSWDIIDSNPLSKVKAYKIDNSPKVRYLSEDEEARLLNALNTDTHPYYLKPMVILSLNTGLRRGEVFNLKWQNLDLKGKLLTVSGAYSKSGKTRHIPLNTSAITALSQTVKVSDDLIFCNRKGEVFYTVKKSWATLLKQAQITKFRWHDMRHHFASKLVMAGVDLNTVRELLGHADIKMTLRYAHLAPEHKAAAVARLEQSNIPVSIIQTGS